MLKFSLQNSLQSFEIFILMWCERLLIYDNLKWWTSDLSFDFGYCKTYDQGPF